MTLQMQGAHVRRRGKTLLGPIDLSLPDEGLTIVLGPNGAGKTTLLRALHGLERLTEGTLSWGIEQDIARQRQAYVFQRPIMLRRSVRDNLAYPLQLRGQSKAQVDPAVQSWAARINLSNAMGLQATRLSGGEQQKLALARALITEPELLFLDEPCSNLDGRATREIEQMLQDALAQGTRIIMTTHDLGQARRLATDALFLLNGKLHEQGKAEVFFNAPSTAETQAFFNGDIIE